MILSDDAIVRGCRSGDPDAFDALVMQFTPLIERRLARLSVPVADRAVVRQEVLVAAAAQLQKGRFRQHAGLTTWLYCIATGKAVDHHRRHATRERVIGNAVGSCDRLTTTRQYVAMLSEALAPLPLRERLAFIRFYVHGLPVEKVAAAMGLSPSRTRELLTMTKALVTRALGGKASK